MVRLLLQEVNPSEAITRKKALCINHSTLSMIEYKDENLDPPLKVVASFNHEEMKETILLQKAKIFYTINELNIIQKKYHEFSVHLSDVTFSILNKVKTLYDVQQTALKSIGHIIRNDILASMLTSVATFQTKSKFDGVENSCKIQASHVLDDIKRDIDMVKAKSELLLFHKDQIIFQHTMEQIFVEISKLSHEAMTVVATFTAIAMGISTLLGVTAGAITGSGPIGWMTAAAVGTPVAVYGEYSLRSKWEVVLVDVNTALMDHDNNVMKSTKEIESVLTSIQEGIGS